jgi:hypothetical protein
MGLPAANEGDAQFQVGNQSSTDLKASRTDAVLEWVENGRQLGQLRSQHDVSIYAFGENDVPRPIPSLPKQTSNLEVGSAPVKSSKSIYDQSSAKLWPLRFGVYTLVSIAFVLLAVFFFQLLKPGRMKSGSMRNSNRGSQNNPRGSEVESTESTGWYFFGAVISGLLAMVLLGVADLQNPKLSVSQTMNWQSIDPNAAAVSVLDLNDSDGSGDEIRPDVDWSRELLPHGAATSLGAAIESTINQERGGPLAGIVVVTDGQSNTGLPVAAAIAAAENAGVPIFPVGVGDTTMMQNVSITDLQAPLRVLPGDDFKIKAVIKSFGFAQRQVRVQVYSAPADDESSLTGNVVDNASSAEADQLDAEMTVTLAEDGELLPIEFELKSEGEGKRRYLVKIEYLERDAEREDNVRTAVVESIQRDTKVLLIAGGPNREFRFLRNQLYRDKNVTLDVWLQTAKVGADQESDQLLFEFPQTTEALFEYDCVIAFDPDWRSLSSEQTTMFERWVAENAGGLILIAGPVNTPEWTRRPRGDEAIDKIRGLYPVSFFNQGSAQLKLGRFGGTQPFPLEFSRAGRAARHLWLGDSGADSAATWGQFEGVFGYYAVNEPKAGADVLASFSDESTAMNGNYPIYLASQFYGAGRVFFQASGEMWRVRRVDVDYFANYYNQVIRWATQGRLLRDSRRGVLLTDRDECWLGDQIAVQAILKDKQDEPLLADSVLATVVMPDGRSETLTLKSSGGAVRPGTFDAQLVPLQEGEYQIRLPIPDSDTNDILSKTIRATIPDLEKVNPIRNDPLLAEIADRTRGHFYVGINEFDVDGEAEFSPQKLIVPQDQETFLTGTLDRFFQRKLMIWLLAWITVAFCAEWTIRRCHKLS